MKSSWRPGVAAGDDTDELAMMPVLARHGDLEVVPQRAAGGIELALPVEDLAPGGGDDVRQLGPVVLDENADDRHLRAGNGLDIHLA